MSLSPELLNLVFQDLTKSELQVARLVCKNFEKAAIAFLFDEIFLAARYSDLKVADHVASHFGKYVKTITLYSVEYEPFSMEKFRARKEFSTTNYDKIDGHLEHAFELYCRAQRENLEIYQNGELTARLCLILSKTPNSRKMILTDYDNRDFFSTPELSLSHDPLKKDSLCPFKVCSLSISDHLQFHVRPAPPYKMTPNPFHLATLAISLTKSAVTELVMLHHSVHRGPKESFLVEDSFNMTTQLSYCCTILLQQLTRLRMRLFDDGGERQAGNSCVDRPIAKALSSAVNLESLFIEGDYAYHMPEHSRVTMMSTFLKGCRFSKLNSLILTNLNSTEDELLDFLKTSPCLKHLTIEFFSLVLGSWQVVAQRIRSALQLKSVMLDMLTGTFSNRYSEYYCKNHDLVERFFLHNGENPFTERAMDLWSRPGYNTRRDIREARHSEKRYERFR